MAFPGKDFKLSVSGALRMLNAHDLLIAVSLTVGLGHNGHYPAD